MQQGGRAARPVHDGGQYSHAGCHLAPQPGLQVSREERRNNLLLDAGVPGCRGLLEQVGCEVFLAAIGQNRDDRSFVHPLGHLGRRINRRAGANPRKNPFLPA